MSLVGLSSCYLRASEKKRPSNEAGVRKMKISVPLRGRARLGRVAQLARRADPRFYESAKTPASFMALSDGKRRRLADARTAARIGASLDVKRPSDRRT